MDILNERGIKTQRIKGVEYVFVDTPYWDKAKKQNRHKRDYIGKIGDDGAFVPNKKFANRQDGIETEAEKYLKPSPIAERKYHGATYLFDCIGSQIGLSHDLCKIFGEDRAKKIMSLAYFLVLESESSMYRFDKFAKTHTHPYGKTIASQRISELFSGITEDEKLSFFRLRVARCLQEEYLAYDTTSISSYSEMMKMVKYGKNKDMESLPQINLALVFGEKSMNPVYYRKLPGNISDVSTLEKLLKDMAQIGVEKAKFVFDRGFFSKENINALYRGRHKFVAAGRANTNLYKDFLKEARGLIKGFNNYNEKHGVYAMAKTSKWHYEYIGRHGERKSKDMKLNLFAYYDGERAEREKAAFIVKLKEAEAAYLSRNQTASQQALLEAYFHCTDTPDGYIPSRHNEEAIESRMAEFGYFMLISDHVTDAGDALTIYRNKDVAEKAFCNIKHRLDLKRTRVSSEEALEGKLFLQFIALSYVSHIHQVMSKNNLYKNYSMSLLLDELDVIEIFKHSNRKIHTSEITKKQANIFECFNVSI